ncbi:expressed protein [Echinococcus multilocularis]|uniref:Expressed protein n=1 Tax=Echinococcus multilocularis TaxID=6211 RepID=A0A068Y396_ECHMU|nr:expressed protein [Echinococcus multilocularis]
MVKSTCYTFADPDSSDQGCGTAVIGRATDALREKMKLENHCFRHLARRHIHFCIWRYERQRKESSE